MDYVAVTPLTATKESVRTVTGRTIFTFGVDEVDDLKKESVDLLPIKQDPARQGTQADQVAAFDQSPDRISGQPRVGRGLADGEKARQRRPREKLVEPPENSFG